MQEPELHLFIIWPKARCKESEIVSDLEKKFSILEKIEISWSKNKSIENFSRFYSATFLPKTIGVDARGHGTFLVITLLDNDPRYEVAFTSSGHALVNINILNLKNKYREWIDNEYGIHSTVTLQETKHDILLLTGKSYDEYLLDFEKSVKKSGCLIFLSQDLIGSNGWKNIEQVFYVLNQCANYTMLRDFEASARELGTTSDIDILVDDITLEMIPFVLNSKVEPDETPGTFMCNVLVENQSIPFHLHSFSYLSPRWVLDILSTRNLSPNKLYVPSLENQFYSLYYQLIHWKFILKDKYKDFLERAFKDLFKDADAQKNNFDDYSLLLNNFISKHEYFPHVVSYLRQNPIEIFESVRQKIESFGLIDIKPYRLDLWKAGKEAKFFTGLRENGQKVFIKYFGHSGILKKEYKLLDFFCKNSHLKFPKPFLYSSSRAGHQMLVTEFIDAQPISEKLIFSFNSASRKKIFEQIVEIVKYFNANDLIHRDIDPSNIIITKNGEVFIIDYEYMVHKPGTLIDQNFDRNLPLQTLYNLGVPNNMGILKWNDAYSALKIMTDIEPKFKELYPSLHMVLTEVIDDPKTSYFTNKREFHFYKRKIKHHLSILIKHLAVFGRKIAKRVNHYS